MIADKAKLTAAALDRVDFWRIWADESQTLECRTYFRERQNHWVHVAKSFDLIDP